MVNAAAIAGSNDAAVPIARLRTRAKRTAQVVIHTATVWLAARLILPWLDRSRREAVVARWARRTLRIFNVRVAVRGSRARSGVPVMMVANHISWLDMYVMNALCVSRFVAKSEVASTPVFGTIARQLGAIFIRRGSLRDAHRVKGDAAAALRGGDAVGLFPEGTTSDGTRLRFFYPALFQAAIEAGATVQPIAIRYYHDDGRPSLAPAYTDEVTLVQSIRAVLREPALRAEITFCEPILSHIPRRELAERARQRIAEALDVWVLPPRPRHTPVTWSPPHEKRRFARPIFSAAAKRLRLAAPSQASLTSNLHSSDTAA
ncbi:MAG: lysophospholipid acyltransferase family protein [Candidatus Binataceae bacterium]|jgi:1-acyl-sn-glycerol-3-phosphate acyltransferase